MTVRNLSLSGAAFTACAASCPAVAVEFVIRHNVPSFPIAATIEVPAGFGTVYVSGMGADIADPSAKSMTLAAYGNTCRPARHSRSQVSPIRAG